VSTDQPAAAAGVPEARISVARDTYTFEYEQNASGSDDVTSIPATFLRVTVAV